MRMIRLALLLGLVLLYDKGFLLLLNFILILLVRASNLTHCLSLLSSII